MKKINNKKATFDYFIESRFEVGIVLLGSEVKSIRLGKVNIEEAYAYCSKGEIFLSNCNIAHYDKANRLNHNPLRIRKLLLHRSEIRKILGKIKQKTYTLIPLSIYFNEKGLVKLELATVKGKKLHDKRQAIKKRDWEREQSSLMRSKFK